MYVLYFVLLMLLTYGLELFFLSRRHPAAKIFPILLLLVPLHALFYATDLFSATSIRNGILAIILLFVSAALLVALVLAFITDYFRRKK